MNDYDYWREQVRRALEALVPCGNELLTGIPEPALRMRFRRGDEADTMARVIVEDNPDVAHLICPRCIRLGPAARCRVHKED